MAQRLTITSFMSSVCILRFNYNANFFPFSSLDGNLDDDAFNQLMLFCFVMVRSLPRSLACSLRP